MNQIDHLEIRSTNGQVEVACGSACSRLNNIDAKNLISALKRTLTADLGPGERLLLTKGDLELQHFAEFITVTFKMNDGTGIKEVHAQLNKQQVPSFISELQSRIEQTFRK